jgi:hypothetical protein
MVAKKTSQVRKMFGIHTGSRQTPLMRVMCITNLLVLHTDLVYTADKETK